MSGVTVLVVAVPVFLLLVAALLVGAARRRDSGVAIGNLSRETRQRDRRTSAVLAPEAEPTGRDVERAAEVERREPSRELARIESAPPAPWVPPDDDSVGVTRRQFLNRSIVNTMSFGLGAFGLACIGFLWPQGSGGFGSKIRIGSIEDVNTKISEGNGFAYYPDGRMWVTKYPAEALDKARQVSNYAPVLEGMEAGFVALYQKCVHLGCRVPQCETSQWFECPCHGSQYNQVGEKKGGPAPRGLDRFPMTISGGAITVDTGVIIQGPPIGTNTTGQEAEGPHCIGAVESH